MSSLVLRLAGPLQSWGEASPSLTRRTLPYPTYSGILGLCKAALGYGRDGYTSERDLYDDTWLRNLNVFLRLDSSGELLTDYHTVNPPDLTKFDWVNSKDRKLITLVPNGAGKEWVFSGKKGKPAKKATLLTERHYMQNATFYVVFTGTFEDIEKLKNAILNPVWQLSLGRKTCLPDFPLVLGTSESAASEILQILPTASPSESIVVHEIRRGAVNEGKIIYHWDDPLGNHPHSGSAKLARKILKVSPPKALSKEQVLEWAKVNLK